ncbi:MAG: cupredoxin family protein [Rhizobacter sp.]|nr:cupredoxin family protein [Rhizobacter sp.]
MNIVRTGFALALATLAALAQAHGDDAHPPKKHRFDASKVEERAFGREGDPKKVSRTIHVDMSDAFRFTPSEVVIKRGETVKFVVSNSGKQLHEMVLGTAQELQEHAELMKKFPDMEHADANMAHVKPGAKREIVWQFNKAGEYRFACLIPGHFEAGMVGKVVVK